MVFGLMAHKKAAAALLTALACSIGLAGCGTETGDAVAVQSVAMLAGLTDVMQHQQFVGMVSTGKEESINRDSTRRIAEVRVKVNDVVEAGDVLFVYDAQNIKDTVETEKLQLEIDKANLESEKKTLDNLQAAAAKASADKQLEYSLAIREQELSIREKEYNITKKEKEIKSLEDSMSDVEVKAPFAGRVTKAGVADNASGGSEDAAAGSLFGMEDSSTDGAFIKIVEIDNYRIKGTINEQNKGSFMEGDSMRIYSRTDASQVWHGVVSQIDYKSPQQNDNGGDYGLTNDEMTTSSKYTFYVDITDLDGLMIGQHVYMRVDDGTPDPDGKIRLDASFVLDADGDAPWVWAEGASGKLEKRAVSLGEYNGDMDTWVVEDGIDEMDYIASPSENCTEGALCRENSENAFDDGTGEGVEGTDFGDGGMPYGGEDYDLGGEDIDFGGENYDFGGDDYETGGEVDFDEVDFDDGGVFG